MAKILDMPKLSPTMEEGVLSIWHKNEGDTVGVDDLLAEVETDKATMEFRSFDKGTILKLLVTAGAAVKLGQPVAIMGSPGEDITALLAQVGSASPAPAPVAVPVDAPPSPTASPAPAPAAPAPAPAPAARAPVAKGNLLDRTNREPEFQEAPAGRVLASPFVRKTARELGLDLSRAQGSGPHGRVVPADLSALPQAAAAAAPAGPGTALVPQSATALAPPGLALAAPEVRPLSPMRKTIARRLTEAKRNVPHFYLTVHVDAGPLSDLRDKLNRELAAGQDDKPDAPKAKLSINDLLIKAVALSLERVPECNAQFTEDGILVHKRVDISVAVAVPDGLVTPVVRNANQKSLLAIAREVRELASRARQKKLRPEEMSEGTFSISNLGMFGIDEFAAVINPPEGAILAVGQVREEPVVQDGRLAVGRKLTMTLSCDHRVVDGAVGAAFLAELRNLLAHPMRVALG